MSPSIAVVGAGMMGAPMARRLIGTGATLTVCDTRPDVLATFAAAGAVTTSSAVDCAGSDIIVVVVSNDAQVLDVLTGPDGLSDGIPAGHQPVVVIMSTVAPETVAAVGVHLAHHGVEVVDAPVSGGETAAEAGTLTILAGGDGAALERVRPVLGRLGRTFHCGPLGAGVTTKIVNNLVAVVNAHLSAEAYRIAMQHELSLELTGEIVDASSGRNLTSGPPGPPTVYSRWTQSRTHFESLTGTMRKDLKLAATLAESTGGEFPLIAALTGLINGLDGDLFSEWRSIADAGS